MVRIGWEIHYNDLSVYTDTSGVWGNAPTSGVAMILEDFGYYKDVYMGMDYYYMDPMPSGTMGVYLEVDKDDYSSLPSSGVKVGSWTDDAIWKTIHKHIFGV